MSKRGFSGAMMKSFGAKDHQVTVTGVEQLTPHFIRLWMQYETVFDDALVAPTAWLRFWFPSADGSDEEHQRAYTLVDPDPDAGTFGIDAVLHEPAGPASAWIASARIGDTLAAQTLASSNFELPPELPAGYLVIGDSASIPGIRGILQTVPDDVPIELYLEEHDPLDRLIPLDEHPLLTLHWVPRTGEDSLAAAIESRDWSNWSAWAACEAGSLQQLKSRLRDDFGFPRADVYALAYWNEGRAFGKRRSRAEEKAARQTQAAVEPASPPASEAPAARGSWRSQAGRRLLAPLKSTLWAAGVLQGLVTIVQLLPYVLLVSFATLLLQSAPADQLWGLGWWTVLLLGLGTLLATGLMLWLHAVDANFARDLRQRLLGKLARVRSGWFDSGGSGKVKQVVTDDTLALHYLVTHAVLDAVAAAVAPIAVLIYRSSLTGGSRW